MSDEGLKELYVEELKDIYNAENQLVKALPKLVKAAASDELRQGLEEHLEQTKGHVARLEQIFEMLDESPKGKKCAGMAGLVEEGSEVMKEGLEGAVLDAALIGAAQRVEHYEIAAYGTVIAFAQTLGESDHAALLEETLSKKRKRTKNSLNSPCRSIRWRPAKTGFSRPRAKHRPGSTRNELRNRARQAFKTGPRPRSRTWAGLLPPL